jgi:hypothetical protein
MKPGLHKAADVARHFMKHLFLLLLIVLTVSCRRYTAEWSTIDFGSFRMSTPYGWKEFDRQGIDSYVGGLTNGKDSLFFDYGWYSPDIGDEDPRKHLYAQDTINGLVARLVIPIKSGDGYIGMYIPVNEQDKFSIVGYNIQETDTILKIFKSIVFKESDTSKNGMLTSRNFKLYPNGTGRSLFSQYCASCHAVNKTLVGPALSARVQVRSIDWIYVFLTNRAEIGKDTSNGRLVREFQLECYQFPNLKIDEVTSIVEYIKSK